MKLVSYLQNGEVKIGAVVKNEIYPLHEVNETLSNDIISFLKLDDKIILKNNLRGYNTICDFSSHIPFEINGQKYILKKLELWRLMICFL